MNDYNIDEKIYPKLPQQSHITGVDGSTFRLKKSSDILVFFFIFQPGYAGVRKKYKRAQSVLQIIKLSD